MPNVRDSSGTIGTTCGPSFLSRTSAASTRTKAIAGLAHPVALDRLGEDHRRLPAVVDGRAIGRIDLLGVVAPAVERPHLGVGHARDHRPQLGARAEEVLAHEGAVAALVGLVVA